MDRYAMSLLALQVLVLVGYFTIGCTDVRADYYRYTDSRGAVCITDSVDAVPPRYRATMKVIRDETLAKRDKGWRPPVSPGTEAQPGSPPASREQSAPGPEDTPVWPRPLYPLSVVKPAATFFVVIVAFSLVKKIAGYIPSAALGRLIILIFFLAVSVAGFKAYGEHMSASYFSIKDRMQALFEKANRREMPEAGQSPLSIPGQDNSSP